MLVVCCLLFVVCHLFPATCSLLLVPCYLLIVTCHLLRVTCYLLRVSCYAFGVTCYLILTINYYSLFLVTLVLPAYSALATYYVTCCVLREPPSLVCHLGAWRLANSAGEHLSFSPARPSRSGPLGYSGPLPKIALCWIPLAWGVCLRRGRR